MIGYRWKTMGDPMKTMSHRWKTIEIDRHNFMEELFYVEIGLDALFLCSTSENLEDFSNVKSPA